MNVDEQHSWAVSGALDLRSSLRAVMPTTQLLFRSDGHEFTFTLDTSEGAATVTLVRTSDGVGGSACGPGAGAALDSVPQLVGLDDDPHAFRPGPGLVADMHKRNLGLRLGATGRVFDAVVPTVLGQRVTTDEAKRNYRNLVSAIGVAAPGDAGMRLPPQAERVLELGFDDFLAFGIERARARVLREAARSARRLEEITGMDRATAEARLLAFPGIGPWTAANVMGVAWGDRDAVPIGDLHLPNTVAWVLAGEARATDERMLELLEPFRPYRRRALSLIKKTGIQAPRYGPRAPKSALSRGLGPRPR